MYNPLQHYTTMFIILPYADVKFSQMLMRQYIAKK
jgi:hypothetical protein